MVVLERVVDGVSRALAEVEGRVEQLGAAGNSEARNDAENSLRGTTHVRESAADFVRVFLVGREGRGCRRDCPMVLGACDCERRCGNQAHHN